MEAQLGANPVNPTDLTIVGIFTGAVMPFAGANAPPGWLLCYGQAISRTTYANLFTVIGITYGAGDGSTTFNLPDLRGRAVHGLDNMGGTAAGRLTGVTGSVAGTTLGAVGGEETHLLALAEMPSHSHPVSAYEWPYVPSSGGGNLCYTRNSNAVNGSQPVVPGGGVTAGSGAVHNNVPPTIVLNYLIKT